MSYAYNTYGKHAEPTLYEVRDAYTTGQIDKRDEIIRKVEAYKEAGSSRPYAETIKDIIKEPTHDGLRGFYRPVSPTSEGGSDVQFFSVLHFFLGVFAGIALLTITLILGGAV